MKYFLWFLIPILAACSNDDGTVEDSGYIDIPLALNKPSNFPDMVYDLSANPPTEKGFELGKKLFYDGRLSSDGLISCGFCQIQANAFTHHGHTVSHGVNDQLAAVFFNLNTPRFLLIGNSLRL